MSCYEWESGSIKVPTAQWAGFKKAIRDAINSQIDNEFILMTRLFQETLKAGKGKRKFNFRTAFLDILNTPAYENLSYRVNYNMFPNGSGAGVKPVRPLKKNFPKLTNKTNEIDSDNCTVGFNDKYRTVCWNVSNNNHAVERAHGSTLGRAFFSALSKITWTRGSGGELVGNDEYNRDSDESGGGANYTTSTYGPVSKKKVKRSLYR